MSMWAKAPAARDQLVLISQTLDELVAQEHPVRLLDAFLGRCDWRAWEARYDGQRGQPPIHPKYVAGCILYGLIKRIRSSRELEEATRERLDFRWLLSGRTIDHSTFAAFRTKFGEELKGLNRALSGELVVRAGGAALVELILDGTRVRANSERNGARSAESLVDLIVACSERLDEKLAQLGREDAQQDEIQALRRQMRQIEAERDKYRAAAQQAHKRDEVKREIYGAKSKPTRVPVTDPDSTILPNKEGGFAPNYTPTAAVEGRSGAIVSAHVVTGGQETQAVSQAVEDCRQTLGRKPDRVVADSNFADGKELEHLERGRIDAYMPVGLDLSPNNPANRADPSEPIAPELWPKLPLRNKRLAQGAFIYDARNDQYHCPMGKALNYCRKGAYLRTGIAYRAYACAGKKGCPLAGQCAKGTSAQRTISRNQYQDVRQRAARRMASEAGRAIYRRRAPSIEGVFCIIKQSLGIRQFLLRGIGKVRTEWGWACGAYNLKKLLTVLQTQTAGAQ
jgi:transposase